MAKAKAATIELIENRGGDDGDIVVPNRIRINGQEVLVSDADPITIKRITSKDMVELQLTLIVGRLLIGHEHTPEETKTDG